MSDELKTLSFTHHSLLITHHFFSQWQISERSHRLQLRGQWRLYTAFPCPIARMVLLLPARFMHRRDA
ncbi:MAG TPA: hypothetical protein VM095_10180, partial [Pyrinomonadaceae bacterium]|nr:hypothetical protein [Pyrinomonadaceae bacterium]